MRPGYGDRALYPRPNRQFFIMTFSALTIATGSVDSASAVIACHSSAGSASSNDAISVRHRSANDIRSRLCARARSGKAAYNVVRSSCSVSGPLLQQMYARARGLLTRNRVNVASPIQPSRHSVASAVIITVCRASILWRTSVSGGAVSNSTRCGTSCPSASSRVATSIATTPPNENPAIMYGPRGCVLLISDR